jgi:hypothetical protein
MPLDLHLGSKPYKHVIGRTSGTYDYHQETILQCDENQHAGLFSNAKIHLTAYPLLTRMEDYYGDTLFHPPEFEQLKKEIRDLLSTDNVSPEARKFLEGFDICIQRAVTEDRTMYFIAD